MRLYLAVLLAGGIALAAPAAAEVSVTPAGAGFSVTATQAPLGEVLDELSKKSGSAIALSGGEDVVVDGSFEGSLETVLGDILRNTSFLISDREPGNRTAGLDVQVITGAAAPPSVAGIVPPGIIEQPPTNQPGCPDGICQ